VRGGIDQAQRKFLEQILRIYTANFWQEKDCANFPHRNKRLYFVCSVACYIDLGLRWMAGMSAIMDSVIREQSKPKRNRRSGYSSAKKGQRIAPPSKTVAIRLPVALWERLEAEAGKAGVTRNKLVRRLCEQGLSDDC